jgi:ABC-type multidrug transport system ATPase subunit
MKRIISGFTGYAKPNELIGLLGPSGSGKTVFMNMISDRLHPPDGSVYERNVYVNKGEPLTRELFGNIGAYVMQDDVLLETLTPYECLMFSANLRLEGPPEEKEKRVRKVIADLGLEKCKDTLVGDVLKKGISGGERKRTSIGVELVTDPSLIILDGNIALVMI